MMPIGPATPNPWNNYLVGAAVPTVTSANISLAALAALPTYANDAAAAAGGVPIGAMYRNGNFLMVRLS